MKFIFPQLIFNIEKWKWNEEYQVYVSTLGHFKDKNKKNLPVLVKNSGYLSVKTPVGIKSCHRLVLLTWRPIPNAEELTVDHLNHNKRDNSLNNLEWVTRQENLRRARKDYYSESEDFLKPTTRGYAGMRKPAFKKWLRTYHPDVIMHELPTIRGIS